MQLWLTFAFILLTSFVATQGQLVGGSRPVTGDDQDRVDKAKKMVENTLKSQVQNENGYDTELSLSDWEASRQVVNGLLYNLKWKTTYTYKCANGSNCAEKAPKTETCTAGVWMRAGSENMQYANGKEPKCSASQ